MFDLTLTRLDNGDLHVRPASEGGRAFFDHFYSTAVVGAVIAPTGREAVEAAARDMGLTVGDA